MSQYSHRSVKELKDFIKKYNSHFRIMLTGKKKADLVKEIADGMKKSVTEELRQAHEVLKSNPKKPKKPAFKIDQSKQPKTTPSTITMSQKPSLNTKKITPKPPAPKPANKSKKKEWWYVGPLSGIDRDDGELIEDVYLDEGWEIYRREGTLIWMKRKLTDKQAKEELRYIMPSRPEWNDLGTESSKGKMLKEPNVDVLTYEEEAKQVFQKFKGIFGHDHFAQVEISGYGTLNWDGYNLYDKELFGRGKKVGTYENKKHLKEWNDYGEAFAFTKYDPLELTRKSPGLKLKG